MENLELAVVLRTFSPEEKERLLLFLQSPYYSTGIKAQQSLQLVQIIFRHLASAEASELTPQGIYAEIYSDRDAYKAPTLNNLISHTLKLVRRFVETEQNTISPVRAATLHTQFFLNKGELDLCDKYLARLEELRNTPEPWNDEAFFANWQAEWVKSMCLGMQNRISDDYNLQGSLAALEMFYLLKRLDILATLFNQNRLTPVIGPEERAALIESIEGWAHTAFYQSPLVQLYRKVLLFLHLDNEAAEKAFEEFMALLYQTEEKLSLEHLKRFESFAYNFCVRRFGNESYRSILFQLFNRWIQPQRLGEQETVQSNSMLSMVHTGLIGQQFEWVQAFLEAYRTRIKGSQPSEDYYRFCKALYLFYIKRFDEARELLVQLSFHETMFKYFSKTLTIKVFYELGKQNFELAQTQLNNLKIALYRETKMTEELKERYKLFYRFMNRLINLLLEPAPDRSQLKKLANELNSKQNAVEWRWLTEKLNALLDPTPK